MAIHTFWLGVSLRYLPAAITAKDDFITMHDSMLLLGFEPMLPSGVLTPPSYAALLSRAPAVQRRSFQCL
jgi:hypothetical protein